MITAALVGALAAIGVALGAGRGTAPWRRLPIRRPDAAGRHRPTRSLPAVATFVSWRQGRRRHVQVDTELPSALDRVAAALRAGASLSAAIATTGLAVRGPLGAQLTAVAERADRGMPLAASLDVWATSGSPAVRLAAAALGLGAEAGGAMARAVDGVATTLRERQELARERRVLSTQARASAAVIAVAPLGFALLVAGTDRAALAFLLGSPLGLLCLGAGLALEAAGAVWMARIVGSAS